MPAFLWPLPFSSLQYTFTATPVGGGPPVTVTSTAPDVRFEGLLPSTEASIEQQSLFTTYADSFVPCIAGC